MLPLQQLPAVRLLQEVFLFLSHGHRLLPSGCDLVALNYANCLSKFAGLQQAFLSGRPVPAEPRQPVAEMHYQAFATLAPEVSKS